ncbi:MAG: stage V sporulation protein AD [Bacillota bacterium]|jgi:stage V sporulation protein AD
MINNNANLSSRGGNIIQKGRQTWVFEAPPYLVSSAAVGGTMEKAGPLAEGFDYFFSSNRAGQDTFEQAEQVMLEKACNLALEKAKWSAGEVDMFLAGDLMNQITSSGFTARNIGIPYLGIFAACGTSMQGLALASLLVASQASKKVMAATGSHNCTAERQFRYPTEYGAQKPPYCQYTATAAGAGIVSYDQESPIQITAATIGKVIDLNIKDPFNMGAAMAPAAANTISAHLEERGVPVDYYDLIITGDLGQVGHQILFDLLEYKGIFLSKEKYVDCGCLLYSDNKEVFSGGSGCGCAAAVTYGHFAKLLTANKLQKIFVVSTGALLSPVSSEQKESIPGIAHGVALERRGV